MPVEQLQPFGWGHIVGLLEAGWTYRQTAAHVGQNVSMVYSCFQQWCVEHSHTHRPGSGWHIVQNTHQDRCIVQAAVAARTASRVEIWAYVAPAVSPRPLGTFCLQQVSDHVCLWPGYHLHHETAKHCYSGVMKKSTGEWNGTLLSSVMRIGSVGMRVMDIHVYGVDLVSIIFQRAFAYNTHAPSQLSWCRGPSVTTYITFGVSAR